MPQEESGKRTNSMPLTTEADILSLAAYFGVPKINEKGVTVVHAKIIADKISDVVNRAVYEGLAKDKINNPDITDLQLNELRLVYVENWERLLVRARESFINVSSVVDLSPRKRAKGLKILEIFTQDQIDESGFGDSDLGAFLRMQTDILRHHENSGLHDKTGIMNAKRFVQFLELVIQRWDFDKEAGEDEQREVPKDLFLVFMDLDNFKELNNQLSYQGADEVLKEFALFIQEYTDECQGVASHWAGDEYVIFAPTQGSADDFPIRWQQRLNALTEGELMERGIAADKIPVFRSVTASLGGVLLEPTDIKALKTDFEPAYKDLEARAAEKMVADKKERKVGRGV